MFASWSDPEVGVGEVTAFEGAPMTDMVGAPEAAPADAAAEELATTEEEAAGALGMAATETVDPETLP